MGPQPNTATTTTQSNAPSSNDTRQSTESKSCLPKTSGTVNTALVLGDAACVYKDVEAALELFTPEVIAATNNIGAVWEGHVDHWFTLHPLQASEWVGIELAMKRRLSAGLNRPYTWAHKSYKGIDYWTPDWAGSTGLLAVKGLLEIGMEKIVLAGVPMNKQGAHYYNDNEWTQATRYHKGWVKHHDIIAPYVRSVSGWTMECFGFPTRDWLESSRERKD